MVRLDRIDNDLRFFILAAQIRAQLDMGPFHFMVHCLADIVEQACAFGKSDIKAEFSGDQSGQLRDLNRMLERILAVTGPEAELAEKPDKFGMDPVHADFQSRRLTFLLDLRINFFFGLFNHLFDSCRMDTSVNNQSLESNAGDFPSDGIKTGNNDRLGSIINDQVYACHGLQCTDVTAFTADDPALHLIPGQLHNRDRRLRDMICRASLDGADHDLLGPFVRFLSRFRLDLFDHNGGIMFHVFFNNF